MSLTAEQKQWHKRYEAMHDGAQDIIDCAYTAAIISLREHGFKTANDDRAEGLVAAITAYVTACNTELEGPYPPA